MSRLCEPQSGDHQKQVALAVLTLLGAGRAARELKTRRAQPRKRRGPKEAKRVFDTGKGVQRAARGHGRRRRLVGRNGPVDDWPQKRILRNRREGACLLRAVRLGPTSRKLLVADEILTFIGERAFENEQIDTAMAVLGIAQNLSEQNLCNKSGVPDWELKDDGEILLQQVDLEPGLERVAHVG